MAVAAGGGGGGFVFGWGTGPGLCICRFNRFPISIQNSVVRQDFTLENELFGLTDSVFMGHTISKYILVRHPLLFQ